jgi:hypothetical protein
MQYGQVFQVNIVTQDGSQNYEGTASAPSEIILRIIRYILEFE